MKTITIAAIALLSAGCNFSKEVQHSKRRSTSVTVAIDPTNQRVYYPTPDEILRQFNFRELPDAACNLRLRLIGDKQHTISKTIRLADAQAMAPGNTNYDSRYRDRNIEAYEKRTRNDMQAFYRAIDTTMQLAFSEIYRTLCDELKLLVKDSSDIKTLVAVTDCRENSDLFNSYRVRNFNVKEIARKLNKVYPLPDSLAGINIIFLFNPRNREEDAAYSRCLELFRYLYESRGAIVEVKTNL